MLPRRKKKASRHSSSSAHAATWLPRRAIGEDGTAGGVSGLSAGEALARDTSVGAMAIGRQRVPAWVHSSLPARPIPAAILRFPEKENSAGTANSEPQQNTVD